MTRLKNLLPFVINGLFTIAFFVHVILIGYKIKHPDQPSVKTYKRDLKDLEFPMAFRVCFEAMENIYDRYHKIGYNDVNQVFSGESKFSKTLFGWNGHDENQSTIFSSFKGTFFRSAQSLSRLECTASKIHLKNHVFRHVG